MLSRRARGERGAAAVEFALVLVPLLSLMFGIITTGLAYTHAIGLTNAVREGSRFGATTDASTSTTWAADVIKRVQDTQFDDPLKQTTVCVQRLPVGGAVTAAACLKGATTVNTAVIPAMPATSIPTGTCVVRVWAKRPYRISVIVPVWDKTMYRQSISRYERTEKVAC